MSIFLTGDVNKLSGWSAAIYKLVLMVLLASASISSAVAAPRYKCSIIDNFGHEIVPCKYSSIQYAGKGLFLLSEVNSSTGWHLPIYSKVVNEDGKEIHVQLPKGSVLETLFVPTEGAASSSKALSNLPPGTLLEFRSICGCGLADSKGKILLEPEYRQVIRSKMGLFEAFGAGQFVLVYDAAIGKRYTDPVKLGLIDFESVVDGQLIANRMLFHNHGPRNALYGYFDGNGEIAINPDFEAASPFEEDGFARVWTQVSSPENRRCYLIDTSGKRVESPEFESISEAHNGLAVVGVRDAAGVVSHGIIDRKFKYLLRPEWHSLNYLCRNMYMAERKSGDPPVAISPDGAELFKFPPDTSSAKESEGLILVFHNRASGSSGIVSLPKNVSVLSLDGRKIYSANNCKVVSFANGTAVLAQDSDVVGEDEYKCTVITKTGITAKNITAWRLEPVGRNRLIKFVADNSFSPVVWRGDANSRSEEFSKFLRNYDLIGMPRSRVMQLLGAPDFGNCYRAYRRTCGSVDSWIELKYDHDCVAAWRTGGSVLRVKTCEPWVTTNVIRVRVVQPGKGGPIMELRPK